MITSPLHLLNPLPTPLSGASLRNPPHQLPILLLLPPQSSLIRTIKFLTSQAGMPGQGMRIAHFEATQEADHKLLAW